MEEPSIPHLHPTTSPRMVRRDGIRYGKNQVVHRPERTNKEADGPAHSGNAATPDFVQSSQRFIPKVPKVRLEMNGEVRKRRVAAPAGEIWPGIISQHKLQTTTQRKGDISKK